MRVLLRTAALAALLFAGCARRPTVHRLEWTTMGTVAAVQWKDADATVDGAALVATARRVFSEIETLLNAHDPTSELNRLASLSDEEVLARCTPSVRPCYAAAFRLRDETDGLFNPRWRGPGTLDLGAIAKGFAVDRAAEALAEAGRHAAILIDLGGNLKAVSGHWMTALLEPDGKNGEPFDLAPSTGCATSGAYYRGAHIRDGRTGAAVTNDVYSVTVVHPSAERADGLSTVLFLLGRTRGERFLRECHPAARAFWRRVQKTQAYPESLLIRNLR